MLTFSIAVGIFLQLFKIEEFWSDCTWYRIVTVLANFCLFKQI